MICGVKTMVINENCKVCQIKRNIDKYPLNATEEEIKEYQHKVKEIVENSDGLSTPQVAEKMDDLRRKIFGNVINYTEIKQHYNQLMLRLLFFKIANTVLRQIVAIVRSKERTPASRV